METLNAALPANETARLDALRRYDLLDTLPETAYDDLVKLAAHICDTPMALLSLVDGERQWFKARVGVNITQTPRDVSFCAHAILQNDVFVVPDASADPRFAHNPLVTGEWGLQFYAGAPLLTDTGEALGTLCVLDSKPRTLTDAQQDALRVLARQAMAQMQLRQSDTWQTAMIAEQAMLLWEKEQIAQENSRLASLNAEIIRAITSILIAVDSKGVIIAWNAAAENAFGLSAKDALGTPWAQCALPRDCEPVRLAERDILRTRQAVRLPEFVFHRPGGAQPRWLGLSLSPMLKAGEYKCGFLLLGADITDRRDAPPDTPSAFAGTLPT